MPAGLVNVIPPNPPSGQVFVRSAGGTEQFEVQAPTLGWKIVFQQLVYQALVD